jgi:metallo-beta-lactamase family protein
MRLRFWGATEGVTGSATFIDLPEGRILLDCGLYQGDDETKKFNLVPLPFRPSEISAVIITHAHLDHTGYLPRLVKEGFRGPIHCTLPTSHLMRIILLDSAKLAEDQFYETADVTHTMSLIRPHALDEHFDLLGASIRFQSAGHILGAASISIKANGKKIVFSGDLGREKDPMLPPHPTAPKADALVVESTYGGKFRNDNMEKELHSFIMTVSRESRVGIIASFAVARGQMLLELIHEFFERHPEDKVRVVMDSPMMKEANAVYSRFARLTNPSSELVTTLGEVDAIEFAGEWESLKKKKGPLIILSSSGMVSGGRITRHLYNWRDDESAILFLPGYQGEATPGRALAEGKRELIHQGQHFTWKGEVITSDAFSSHADQTELIHWVTENNNAAKVFLIHGEAEGKLVLKKKLEERGMSAIHIPHKGSEFEI